MCGYGYRDFGLIVDGVVISGGALLMMSLELVWLFFVCLLVLGGWW